MLKKTILLFVLLSTVLVLTACEPLDSIIEQIRANFFSESEDNVNAEDNLNNDEAEVVAEEVSTETENDTAENNNSENEMDVANENDDDIPFDEKLAAEGYDNLVLPNGFPIQVPYQFILVADNSTDEMMPENYEGQFCYQLPMMENHEVAQLVKDNNETTGQSITGSGGGGYAYELIFVTPTQFEVALFFFVDEYENDCIDIEVAYGEGNHNRAGLEDWMGPGEDPSTMVSEEELAEMEAYQAEADETVEESEEVETAQASSDTRTPTHFEGYDEKLSELASDSDYFKLENDETILSIMDTLTENPNRLAFVPKGVPEIMPYDWYPVKFTPHNEGWNGNFCTDTSMSQAVLRHHQMLENLAADISNLEIYMPADEGNYVYDEFALNDVFGTGSWHGESVFYVEDGSFKSPIEFHKCIQLNMTFSPEILD